MPSKHAAPATVESARSADEPLHKTTINFPESLYQELKLLAAIQPNGSFNSILERAARELVERERDTIDQLKRIAAKANPPKARR